MRAIEMTIDNFPVTNENQEAYEFVNSLIRDPQGQTITLLAGPINQTMHLKHAILNKLTSRVVTQTGSEFTQKLIEAIQNNTHNSLVAQYSSYELYMLDDLQFLAGKEATQQMIYEILKERFEQGKSTVLIASDSFDVLKEKLSRCLIELIYLGQVVEIKSE